jgi:hypothetical protein
MAVYCSLIRRLLEEAYTRNSAAILLALLHCIREVRVQISDQGTAKIIEVSCGFPQSLLKNSGALTKVSPRSPPSIYFPIHYRLIILSFDAIFRATESVFKQATKTIPNTRLCMFLITTFGVTCVIIGTT